MLCQCCGPLQEGQFVSEYVVHTLIRYKVLHFMLSSGVKFSFLREQNNIESSLLKWGLKLNCVL